MSNVSLHSQEKQMTDETINDNSAKTATEYEDEDDGDSSGEEEEEEEGEGSATLQKAKQALTCRKVTLTTLMNDGIIEPGQGVLAIDYLGQRFEADLLESGKIKWHGSEQEFGTPSAWAMHCKRLVNTNNMKRSGCGWASVKYKGKKLDIWKSIWARKLRPIKSPHHAANSSSTTPAPRSTSTSSPSATTTTATTAVKAKASTEPPTTTTSALVGLKGGAIAAANSSHSQSQSSTAVVHLDATSSISNIVAAHALSLSSCNSTNPLSLLPPPSASSSLLLSTSSLSPKSLSALLSTPLPDVSPAPPSSGGNTAISKDQLLLIKGNSISDLSPQKQNSESNATTQLNSPANILLGQGGESQPNPALLHPSLTAGCKRPTLNYPNPPKDWTGQTRTTHTDIVLRDRKKMRYSDLDMRTPDIDMNTLIQCESFDKHKKLQPFSVMVSTNALLLMDFHCHLTRSEVAGYLGGNWDPVKQILTIMQAFPVLCRFADKLQASVVEDEIRRRMKSSKMVVVGWYHSHPYCQPLPSIRDVDCQMAYQLQMRGAGSTYHPCVGFIEAPFTKQDNILQSFWVMPNLENPSSLNIPMNMSYSVRRDLSLTEDILIDMKLLSEFYSGAPDRVRFKEKWKDDVSFLEKIRGSLASKLPEDQLSSGTFLDYMQQLLRDMK